MYLPKRSRTIRLIWLEQYGRWKIGRASVQLEVGLLYYRTDLLRTYGFRSPPRTWDELEIMAARIHRGSGSKATRASGALSGKVRQPKY